jgi:hypothetical protein
MIVFMHCPVVQPAVVWLQHLWARLVPGSQLSLTGRQGMVARVLLAGGRTKLQKTAATSELAVGY